MGIEQKDDRKKDNDEKAKLETQPHITAAGHTEQKLTGGKKGNNIGHHHHAGARQKIRQVQPAVFLDSRPRETAVKPLCHA